MKKVLALLMAAVLLLGLGATAFAAEPTGSITINGTTTVPITGKTFNAYKILDATFTADGKGVAYTVPAGLEEVYATQFKLTEFMGKPEFDEKVTEAVRAALDADPFGFASTALQLAKDNNVVPVEVTAESETCVIDKLPLGYYIVEDKGNKTPVSALMLKTVGTTKVEIKADKPDIDKVIVNADSAAPAPGNGKGTAQDVGSVVDFELTSKVPVMDGYKSYTYIVHDTLSAGLTFNNDVSVTIGGAKYNDFEVVQAGQSFTITFKNFINQKSGDKIVIKYSATLNENAFDRDVETNTVKLEYSNNPNYKPGGEPDNGGTEETPEKKVYVYDFDIVIDKYADAGDKNTETKLAGAEFVLYKEIETGKVYYKLNGNKVEWKEKIEEATKHITDENGVVRFTGLDTGTYYLEETKAPAGYNKLKEPIKVTINAEYNSDGTLNSSSATVEGEAGQLSQKVEIGNKTGTVLPETGGIGTTIFYILGGIMVAGAVILLITKKRMANEK